MTNKPSNRLEQWNAWMRLVAGVVGSIFLLATSALAAVLVWRILTAKTAVTAPADERMLEMVKWTLGLVITVGGLLVGFSWFQSRSRIDEDRDRLNRHVESLNESSAEAVAAAEDLRAEIDRQKALFANMIADLTAKLEFVQIKLEASDRTASFAAKTAYRNKVEDTYERIMQTKEEDSTDSLITIILNFIEEIPHDMSDRDDLVVLRSAWGVLKVKLDRGDTSNYHHGSLERLRILSTIAWELDDPKHSRDRDEWFALLEQMIASSKAKSEG